VEEQAEDEQVGNEGLGQQRLEDEELIDRERLEREEIERDGFVIVGDQVPVQHIIPAIIDDYHPLPQEGQQPLQQQPQVQVQRRGLFGFGGALGIF